MVETLYVSRAGLLVHRCTRGHTQDLGSGMICQHVEPARTRWSRDRGKLARACLLSDESEEYLLESSTKLHMEQDGPETQNSIMAIPQRGCHANGQLKTS